MIDYFILGLVIISIILNIILIILNRRKKDVDLVEKIGKMETDLTKELGEFKYSFSRNLNSDFSKLNETIIRLNNEINNKDMEQKSLLKAMNKIQKEKKEFERTNSKYHSVIYGRFKKKESNKDY